MTQILFRDLQAVRVTLFIEDGRLGFDAPDGALTDELLARLRADREAVLAALVKQTDTPEILSGEIEQPVDPVPESDEMPPGIHCPFCSCRRFTDEPRGMRCRNCSRLAWLFLPNGSAVRFDCAKLDLRFGV